MFYILKDKKAIEATKEEFIEFFRNEGSHRVAFDKIGDVGVSTIFLGINQRVGDGPPILFETVVFGSTLENYMTRCCTWDEAEMMHARMVERVRNADQEVNND